MSFAVAALSLALVSHAGSGRSVYEIQLVPDLITTGALVTTILLVDLEKHTWSGTSPCHEGQVAIEIEATCDASAINGLDQWVTKNYSPLARTLSDVFVAVMIALPIGAATAESSLGPREGRSARFLEDTVISYQAIAAAMLVTEIFKVGVHRPRPLVYNASFTAEERLEGDARLSFPSGHASISFSAATAFAVPWLERHPGAVAALGVSLAYVGAAFVASMRVAGGKHFVTDILAGAAIGIGVGLVVTFSHRRGVEAGSDTRQDGARSPIFAFGASW